jgi:hypothetical protein
MPTVPERARRLKPRVPGRSAGALPFPSAQLSGSSVIRRTVPGDRPRARPISFDTHSRSWLMQHKV